MKYDLNLVIENLKNLLPENPGRDDVLVFIQKLRQNLLLYTNNDNGDYDLYMRGKLEFGNIKKYTNDISKIISQYLISKGINILETEMEELAEKIKNFTINQNII